MKRLLMSGSILLTSVTLLCAGGAPRREDVPKYLEMLKSGTSGERTQAAEMLGKRGAVNVKDVADAIEPLRMALKKDPELKVRRASAKALGMIVPEPAEDTVPLLIQTLGEKDHALRMAVAKALSGYGPEAVDALPALRSFQKEVNDKNDKKLLAEAITAISQKMKKKKT